MELKYKPKMKKLKTKTTCKKKPSKSIKKQEDVYQQSQTEI